MAIIRVRTKGHSYPIHVGQGLSDRLGRMVCNEVGSGRLFVFFDAQFYALYGRGLTRSLKIPSRLTEELVIPPGERAKSQRVLAGVYDFLLQHRITREDLILACGGGVTTDLAGYAAATAKRGIRWAAVPTTLLGMVDAAVGGKTGINHSLGKNLIGAFWQPTFVCSDVRFLATLPSRQIMSGVGEILKYGGLTGGKMMSALKTYAATDDLYSMRMLNELVRLSTVFKANVVARDERDDGRRMILNYGHTIGHAIESAIGFGRLLHGEAVILGIGVALRLGKMLKHSSKGLESYSDLADRMMRRLPKRRIERKAVMKALAHDKKRTSSGLRFVLLERIGCPVVCDGIDTRTVRAAIDSMLTDYEVLGGTDA